MDDGLDAFLETIGYSHRGLAAVAEIGDILKDKAFPRWVVERTHAWMNGYGKLRRRTERTAKPVDSYLAAALATLRQLT